MDEHNQKSLIGAIFAISGADSTDSDPQGLRDVAGQLHRLGTKTEYGASGIEAGLFAVASAIEHLASVVGEK